MENFKPFIKDLIKFYYEDLGNSAGGYYHIVLDDGNVEDGHIWHCQQEAEKNNDTFGIFLGQVLRMFTQEEREKMYQKNWLVESSPKKKPMINKLVIETYLKKRGYTMNYSRGKTIMMKGFTCVYIAPEYIEVKHDKTNNDKSVLINKNLIENLSITLNYFERI